MFCDKCGAKVNISDSFCSSCGKAISVDKGNNDDNGGIIIINRSSSMVGMAIGWSVFIDGEKVGSLENGSTMTINTTVAPHEIFIKIWGTFSKETVVLSKNQKIVSMNVYPKMGLVNTTPIISNITYK